MASVPCFSFQPCIYIKIWLPTSSIQDIQQPGALRKYSLLKWVFVCGAIRRSKVRGLVSTRGSQGFISLGPLAVYSYFPFMWFPTPFINRAAVSVSKTALTLHYNHIYFWSPLSCGSKLIIVYTCRKHCSQGSTVNIFLKWLQRLQPLWSLKHAFCQLESSLRAERTLASSWSAGGRASGLEASMSKSRAHMAGPGGGGSGGALLNFIGMHSWRSAFSDKASPSGINQPERPLHTYAPEGGEKKRGTQLSHSAGDFWPTATTETTGRQQLVLHSSSNCWRSTNALKATSVCYTLG